MTYAVVTFLYPLLLGALSSGIGLLVERLCGRPLPTVLVPVVGFCAMVILAQFLVIRAVTAPATPWVLVFIALLGFALGRDAVRARWQARSLGLLWPVASTLLIYLTVAAPLVAAGVATFPGYLLDTTAGIHVATSSYELHHGMQFPPPYPAYGAMLHAYDGSGYPDGGQVLFAVTGALTGVNLVWEYFPFQVFALAMAGLGMYFVSRRAGLGRPAAAGAAWIAGVPALCTAYALMGSIKELTALPTFVLMAAYIALVAQREVRRIRDTIPFAIACAGAIAAIGPAAAPWVILLTLAALLAAVLPVPGEYLGTRLSVLRTRATIRAGAALLASLVALVVVFDVPTLLRLRSAVSTASSFAGSNVRAANDPGNLVRPLRFVQVFGVWLGTDHRYPPKYELQTYLLIGVVIVAVAAGVGFLVRRRVWWLLVWVATSLLVWLILYERGTEWTDAKVMMLTSPVIVLVAMIGALGDLRRGGLLGGLLALVTAGGVLGSDGLLYHGTNLAPTGRFNELASIGRRFAGRGPTLVTDFDEYSFFELSSLKIDSPGFSPDMRGGFVVDNGQGQLGYALSYDSDNLATDVQRFRLIVMRRSPRWSRPPGNFRLVYLGRWYEVWQRSGPAPLSHLSLGTNGLTFGSTGNPIGRPKCAVVRSLAAQARRHHVDLRYATRQAPLIGNIATAYLSPSVSLGADAEGRPEAIFGSPGVVSSKIRVLHAGVYQVWLTGNIGNRPMAVDVDGRPVGTVSDQLAGDGNAIEVSSSLRLTKGRHSVVLTRGSGSFAPGNGAAATVDGIYLTQSINTAERLVTLSPSRWHSLCGRELDWIEVV